MITDISNNVNYHEYCYSLNYNIPFSSESIKNNIHINNLCDVDKKIENNNNINYNNYNNYICKNLLTKHENTSNQNMYNNNFYDNINYSNDNINYSNDNINYSNDNPDLYQNIVDDFLYSIDLSIEYGDVIYIKNSIQKYKNVLPSTYIKMANRVMVELLEESLEEMDIAN